MKLAALGAHLRAQRKELKLNATETAEAAGVSRVTLHRIERGAASVTIGAYMNVITSLGLDVTVAGGKPKRRQGLLRRVAVSEHQQLRQLAWQLGEGVTLTPEEALSLYERNWRHVRAEQLDDGERAFIRAIGGGHLLV